jgi:hypothetical protein
MVEKKKRWTSQIVENNHPAGPARWSKSTTPLDQPDG